MRPAWIAVCVCVLVALAMIGCGRREEPAPAPPPPPPAVDAPAAEAPAEPQVDEDGRLLGRVRTVDLDGNPVPGMTPIATTHPNAFDAPLSQGAPTDAEGNGALWLPPDARVFVRAWDPDLRQFANNFYDILPARAAETDLMTIQMVEGCAVRARLTNIAGEPLADARVEWMMLHPTQGPWWPARGTTDATGTITFERVPAGQYGYRVEAEGYALDLPAKLLPPGGMVDFGELRLQ